MTEPQDEQSIMLEWLAEEIEYHQGLLEWHEQREFPSHMPDLIESNNKSIQWNKDMIQSYQKAKISWEQ